MQDPTYLAGWGGGKWHSQHKLQFYETTKNQTKISSGFAYDHKLGPIFRYPIFLPSTLR